MVLARSITRGMGERTQAKELRNSKYPQLGLSSSITFDAVNTAVINSEIIGIRVNSFYKPCIINSDSVRLGNRPSVAYMNIKKGENGYGITYKQKALNVAFVPTIVSIAGSAKFIPESYLAQPSFVFSGNVNSYLNPPANGNSTYTDSLLTFLFLSNIYSMNLGYPRTTVGINTNSNPFGNEFLISSNFLCSGLYKSHLVKQGKNNFHVWSNTTQSSIPVIATTGIPLTSQIIPQYDINTIIRIIESEPYVRLLYSQTNTNQNGNAAWLVNQKTQYQRKFNRLKNLEV